MSYYCTVSNVLHGISLGTLIGSFWGEKKGRVTAQICAVAILAFKLNSVLTRDFQVRNLVRNSIRFACNLTCAAAMIYPIYPLISSFYQLIRDFRSFHENPSKLEESLQTCMELLQQEVVKKNRNPVKKNGYAEISFQVLLVAMSVGLAIFKQHLFAFTALGVSGYHFLASRGFKLPISQHPLVKKSGYILSSLGTFLQGPLIVRINSCFHLLVVIFGEHLAKKTKEFLTAKMNHQFSSDLKNQENAQEFFMKAQMNQLSIAAQNPENSQQLNEEERKEIVVKISLLSFGEFLTKLEKIPEAEIPEAINAIKNRNLKDLTLQEFVELNLLNKDLQKQLKYVVLKKPKLAILPLARFSNINREKSSGNSEISKNSSENSSKRDPESVRLQEESSNNLESTKKVASSNSSPLNQACKEWLRLAATTNKITEVTIDDLITKLQFDPDLVLLEIIKKVGPERLLNSQY